MDPTLWTAVGAIATGVSAIVTTVTVIFIARQTSATRRAAEAGEETAKVAVESLNLARKEQDRTLFLALEAVKTRIDNATPRITLTTEEEIEWPPLVPSSYGDPQPHRSTEPFRLPRDGQGRLIVRVGVEIRNEGNRTVSLAFNQTLYDGAEEYRGIVLGPGQALDGVFFIVERSVAEWASVYEIRASGGQAEDFRFEVMYLDPSDTGVIEYHEILFGGTILRPVANELGAWTLIDYGNTNLGDTGAIGWSVQPTKRRYFLSRLRGLELPEIELDFDSSTALEAG